MKEYLLNEETRKFIDSAPDFTPGTARIRPKEGFYGPWVREGMKLLLSFTLGSPILKQNIFEIVIFKVESFEDMLLPSVEL